MMTYCLAHECLSNKHCLRYEKEEDPNRIVVNFQDGLELTKCPEFIDEQFDDMDEMFMLETGLKEVKGVEENGYARRYGKPQEV